MSNPPPHNDMPAPLLGCLFCHAEGTIIQTEGRRLFGLGDSLPTLTCNHCGSVAVLDTGENGTWRIRYRKHNREREYYFAALWLGKGGWLDADEALRLSRLAYIQRQRVQQTQRGDLSWLTPIQLDPPPPILHTDEILWLIFRYVTYRQGQSGRFSRQDDEVIDSGAFYITDRHVHLLGQKRNWSYRLRAIRKVDFNDEAWLVYLKQTEGNEYFRGDNHPDVMDAQLVANIIQALRGRVRD